MKGVVVKEIGGPAVVVDDLEIPEPDEGQVLVKSLYAALNPVDGFMASTGLLIQDWPFVLGCDAAGVIVKVGSNAEGPVGPLKVGDEVLGCTRLGCKGYSTCQEYFLMDASLAVPKPQDMTTAQAATVGVGFYTAALAVFNGLSIPIPHNIESLPSRNEEPVLVLGGASSVGKFAVQLLTALGYKVLASCSPASASLLESLGAAETLDYKLPKAELLEILAVQKRLVRIFDAVASNQDFVKALYEKTGGQGKHFATTNDWTPMTSAEFNGATIYPVKLGPIGRPEAQRLNLTITKLIPLMHRLLETGAVKPAEYEVIGSGDFESVAEAWAYQGSGKAGNKKVLVKLQDA